ncbi:MAG: aldo/keto reductase [Clostridiales bacterium]|nr:aldo/keto reductase [Clostridiales bacterium]
MSKSDTKALNGTFTLSNGVQIPKIGFGTWQTPEGDTGVNAVKCALAEGYRHIDTAAVYGNEKSVGIGIAGSGVPREEIFLTTKVWNRDRGYGATLKAFEDSLERLGVDYVDLYLIHWPANARQFDNWEQINLDTWRAMTELYKAGRIRAIGVSNFLPHHLEALMQTEVRPMINQIEYHPGTMQAETVAYCQANGILVEAWSPLGSGRVLNDPTLSDIAAKYGVCVAQLCVRWCLQNGVLPLPKSVTPSRIALNKEVGFTIGDEDMRRINGMPEFGGSGLNPDEIDF